MNVSPWNWNTTNISPVHPSVNQIPQKVVTGHEELNDYHWVEGEYSQERAFPPIKLHASAAQVQAAYTALTTQGLPANFAQEVWNDIVDKIAEVQTAFGIPEKDRLHNQDNQQVQNPKSAYISSETPGYVSSLPYGYEKDHQNLGSALYAYKFNVLVNAFVALPANWVWPWETDGVEIVAGAPVKGSYIIALTQAINYWINQPQSTFAVTLILKPFIMTTQRGGFDLAPGLRMSRITLPLNTILEAEFDLRSPSEDFSPVEDWVDVFDLAAEFECGHEAAIIKQAGYFLEAKTVDVELLDVFYGIRKNLNVSPLRLSLNMSSTFSHYQGLPMAASMEFGFSTEVSTDTGTARTFADHLELAGLTTEAEFDNRNDYPLLAPVEISSGLTVGKVDGKTDIISPVGNFILPLDLDFLFVYNDVRADRATTYELRYVSDKHWFVTEAPLDVLTYNKNLSATAPMSFGVDCSLYAATPQETPRLQAIEQFNVNTTAETFVRPTKHLTADNNIIRTEFITNAKSCYVVHPEIEAAIQFIADIDLKNDHLKEIEVEGAISFGDDCTLDKALAKELSATLITKFGDDASADIAPRVPLEVRDYFTTYNYGRTQSHRGVSMSAYTAFVLYNYADCEQGLPPVYLEATTAIREVVTASLDKLTANTMAAIGEMAITADCILEYIVGTKLAGEGDIIFVDEVGTLERSPAQYIHRPADTTGTFYTVDDEIFLDSAGDNIVTSLELFNVIRFNMELKGDMFITSDGMQLFTSDDKEFTPL